MATINKICSYRNADKNLVMLVHLYTPPTNSYRLKAKLKRNRYGCAALLPSNS